MALSVVRRALRPVALVFALNLAGTALAQDAACPRDASRDGAAFPDGVLAMRTGLTVNPDGAAASYTPGDHGYTYISNGVNLLEGGAARGCSEASNTARCRQQWLRAEAAGFGPGSPEFCAYAIEVEPIAPGTSRQSCGDGRYVVGNGKGRPVMAGPVPAFGGGTVTPYLSTTALRQRVGERTLYIDSGAIPGLVAPRSRPELVGAVAWVRHEGRETFAIVNDTGPAFGEGSVALHQLLRRGDVGPAQPVGPIPVARRCSPEETGLLAPFQSRPDGGAADRCRAGRTAVTPADIRAYTGIPGGVISIVLPGVRLPMTGRVVSGEVTRERLEQRAREAGYTPERLRRMADCLPG